jgi:hypothetical protein
LTDRQFVERAKEDPSRVPELVELYESWVAQNPDRAKEILDLGAEAEREPDTSTEPGETHSDAEPAADGQPDKTNTDDDRAADEQHSDADVGSTGAGADHSIATTKRGRLYGDATAPSWRL